MYTKTYILEKLRELKPLIGKNYGVSELALFGSYAKGDQYEESDIDVLVDFERKIDAFDFIRLAHMLEDVFQHKIDLVSRKGVKPSYMPFVEKTMIHVEKVEK